MAEALGFFDDLADSLAPWRTADLGCIAIRNIPKDVPDEVLHPDDTGPTSEAGRLKLAQKAHLDAEKQQKARSSLALIQLIQAAIDRREALLREIGEHVGTPVDDNARARALAAEAGGVGTPIGRLALEEYTDQALAREELAPVDLAAARVDMSELLPRNAYDPGYAYATAAHAQRSAASMGSFLGMNPGVENGDQYYDYSQYENPEAGYDGYDGYGYGDEGASYGYG